MINIKKGTGHSLLQSDVTGKAKANEAVVAGMLVALDTNGDIVKATTDTAAALFGFALNSQTDGDVINSGKISMITLDGNSVIETDQYAVSAPTAADIGKYVVPDTDNPGKVKWDTAANTTVKNIVGIVEGVRTLPGSPTWSPRSADWPQTTMVGIKLTNGLVVETV